MAKPFSIIDALRGLFPRYKDDALFRSIIRNQEKIMSQLDDLNEALAGLTDAVATLTTSVTEGLAEMDDLLNKIAAGGMTSEQITAAVEQVKAIKETISTQAQAMSDEVAKAKAAAP